MKLNIQILILLLYTLCSITSFQIQSTQPHNKNCYTQGLFFINNTHLFESCGLYNKSFFSIMQYQSEPFTIKNVYTTSIPWKSNIFLQGSVLFKNYIYILTWLERKVYKLNPYTYQVVQQLNWSPDGWGLTANQTHMFVSDGSYNIYIVDEHFNKVGVKSIVRINGQRQNNINQLQYVNGSIYANIYLSSKIVKINIETGLITEQYDGSNLINAQKNLGRDQVLNGIAYDKKADRFLLTGKHWTKIHLAKLTDFTPLSGTILTYLLLVVIVIIMIL